MLTEPSSQTLGLKNVRALFILRSEWIYIICVVGLLLRIGYGLTLDQQVLDNGDGADYNRHALLVMQGEEYPRQGEQPFMRPPLYVYGLVAIYSVTGGQNLMWVRILQAVLDIGTCLALYQIVRLIWDTRIAVLSALLYAFNPYFIFFSARIRVEALFGFLLAVLILCIVYLYINKFKYPWLILVAGVLGGLASLCRPNLVVFGPLLVLWLIVLFGSQWKTWLSLSLLLGAGWFGTILPWTVHNYYAYHEFILVTDGFGYNFWCSNAEPKLADQRATTPEEYKAADNFHWQLMQKLEGEMAGLSPKAKEAIYLQKGLDFIRDNFRVWLEMTGKKVLEFWSPTVRSDVHGSLESLVGLPFGLFVLLGLGAFVRSFWDGSVSRPLWWMFALLFLSAAVVGILFWATPRYRIPMVDPYLIPFALHWIAKQLTRRV